VSAIDEALAPGRAPYHLRTHRGEDPRDSEAHLRALEAREALVRSQSWQAFAPDGSRRTRSWHTGD